MDNKGPISRVGPLPQVTDLKKFSVQIKLQYSLKIFLLLEIGRQNFSVVLRSGNYFLTLLQMSYI